MVKACVFFAGSAGKKFELWNDERWTQLIDNAGGFGAGGLPTELEDFSL